MCPPVRYEGIKRSIRQRNPSYSEAEVKTHAAKIFEATKKPGEMDIQTYSAKERHRRHRTKP